MDWFLAFCFSPGENVVSLRIFLNCRLQRDVFFLGRDGFYSIPPFFSPKGFSNDFFPKFPLRSFLWNTAIHSQVIYLVNAKSIHVCKFWETANKYRLLKKPMGKALGTFLQVELESRKITIRILLLPKLVWTNSTSKVVSMRQNQNQKRNIE